ncbi:MAG TPA: cytochrome C oxidase subunit IV family protein [Acidimicrobiales bacterium]|jgi:cytochrome c oxidase subunit IV|nr:cytochrome C oxidase subunit IV family protein [Acidimicrobiales bacterium]
MSESHTSGTSTEPGPVVKTTPEEGGTEHHHPSDREYIKIAIILAVITAVEVVLYYVEDALGGLVVPSLIILSLAKFVLVVLWFMHLRFDSRLFRRFFVAGLLLATFVYLIVLTTFGVWTR